MMKFFPYRKFAFWYRTKITSAFNSQKRACHYLDISHGIMNRYCNGSDLPSLRFFVKSIRKCCDILDEDLNQTLLDGLALIPNDKPTEFDNEV